LVTVHEDGSVQRLNNVTRLGEKDLFIEFLKHPTEFTPFLLEQWDQADSAWFASHIQPVNPALPCSGIHVVPAMNGQRNSDTVKKLMRLVQILQRQFSIPVAAVAFNGDSCLNRIHDNFGCDYWKATTGRDERSIPRRLGPDPLLICDFLHLLRRIRYQWVAKGFSVVVPGETFCFSLERIREAGYLSPIVFTNSKESKMHDSLPLELFSAKTLSFVLGNDLPENFWSYRSVCW
jgi:hypothetical protein